MPQFPETLMTGLAEGRIVPFVGSGVSSSVKNGLFPTWKGLLEKLADRLKAESKFDSEKIVRTYVSMGGKKLFNAADEAVEELGQNHFHDEMKKVFDVKDPPVGANLALPDALWSLKPQLVVTTNYDRVLQWSNKAAQPAKNSEHSNLQAMLVKSSPEQPYVWHLHGHIDDPDSLVLAPQQYDPLYDASKDEVRSFAAARQQLSSLVAQRPLLFVGFGLQDEYVMDALGKVLRLFVGNLEPSYALLKAGDDRWHKLWEDHRIRAIPYADYGEPMIKVLSEMKTAVNERIWNYRKGSAATTPAPLAIPAAYKTWLADQCADMMPFGMEPNKGQSVALQQVYVPPVTGGRFEDDPMASRAAPKSTKKKSVNTKSEARAEEAKPRLLLQILGERSLYVSGDPGTGKSTFCRWLAWLVVTGQMPVFAVPGDAEFQEKLPDSLRDRLPLLLRLRDFREYLPAQAERRSLTADQFRAALQYWVDKTHPGGLSWGVVELHLIKGSLLLILDGIDELPLTLGEGASAWSPRESVLAGLTVAAADWLWLGNRVLVTSRPYGLAPDQVRSLERAGLAEARLESLPESLQDLLATRWFVALPGAPVDGKIPDGRTTAETMLRQVRGLSDDVAALAANPLLLVAICIIYGEGKQLPQDIHDLYHRIVNTALYSRYPRVPKVIELVRARLSAVALGMHTGDPHEPTRDTPAPEVSYTELNQILGVFIAANPETESGYRNQVEAREDLLAYSGLLSQATSERASFFHLSFQEFLSAEQLARLNDGEDKLLSVFCERCEQPNWRPTLKFLFARRVVQPGWRAGVELLGKLMDQIDIANLPGSLGLALTAVDAFDILLDRELKLQGPILDRFRSIVLAAIEQLAPPKARHELARMLGRIGDPRVPVDLNDPAAWVVVPAGRYTLGDSKLRKEYKRLDKLPAAALEYQMVQFDQSFQISKYPVTNGQYASFLAARGYHERQYWSDVGWKWRVENKVNAPAYWTDSKWNGTTQPIVGISWFEAEAFCRWAGFRLPTEREWEAAARGHDRNKYAWGDEWTDGICNSSEAGLEVTTPVGIFPKAEAACGAHDMTGNVWEWCEDWHLADERNQRVVRGGSWFVGARFARAAIRGRGTPDDRDSHCGFRVVSSSRTS